MRKVFCARRSWLLKPMTLSLWPGPVAYAEGQVLRDQLEGHERGGKEAGGPELTWRRERNVNLGRLLEAKAHTVCRRPS